MMSRSRNVSLRRRTEPASETCTAAGCSRSTATTACTAGSPSPSSRRPASGFSAWNASALRIFSSLFAPRPGSARSCSDSAAAFSSASVEMPSSCQMRAAVFGPSPGRRMKRTTSGGIVGLALRQAPRSRRSRRSGRSSPRSSCRFPAAPSPCRRARAARPSPMSRASSSRRGGRRARETTRRPRARAGRQAGRTAPRRRRFAGSAATTPILGLAHGLPVACGSVPDATVCLPTYNERENLEAMLRALAPLGVRVLVIDDNSPDGTGEIADRLAAELDFVSVLHRERKEGLGPAYLAGFTPRARRRRGTDPRDGLRLLPRPEGRPEVDRRVRSRSRSRARLPVRSGRRHRQLGARAAHRLLGRLVLRTAHPRRAASAISPAGSSATAGACSRRSTCEAIHSKGYAFQIEGTYRTLRKGFTVVEVPIRFADRTEGVSKMSRSIFLEAVVNVPRLRLAALRGLL